MKAAIIDFNRTLWNPETNDYIPNTRELLQTLKDKGLKLALVSFKENYAERLKLIIPLTSFFDIVKIVDEKTSLVFKEIITDFNATTTETLVIGDKISDEIKIGNLLGMTTIRLKSGKYAEEEPQ